MLGMLPPAYRNISIPCIVFIILIVQLAYVEHTHPAFDERSDREGSVRGYDLQSHDIIDTRYCNTFTDDFQNMDFLDFWNSTAAMDTYNGRILLSGAGGAGGSPTGHVSLAAFNTAMGTMFINTMANFNTHPLGALQGNFYAGIGISSMTTTSGTVQNTEGPGQGNTGGAILGEGHHQRSPLLSDIRPNSAFTLTFASAQSGVGFMVVDKFTGGGVTLKGYAGPQGTGNLIATATAPNSNYQRNNMVFMGVTDGGVNSIRSVVWNIPNNGGDDVGIDDIRFGATGVMNNMSSVQSLVLHDTWDAVGAARLTWYEHTPTGTTIVYNLTADGEHWITVENNTNVVFEHIGSQLMWNATMTTEDEEVSPYIDKVIIDYDLVSDPDPHGPISEDWQGTSTPTLKWNFTDPDPGDHQTEYRIEIFDDENMTIQVQNTSWKNSTVPEHTLEEKLEDGAYHWRVRTRDEYHAHCNFSILKKIMIDVTKPVGNITIEEGAMSVNEQLVNIAINASDNGSGIADMQIISDSGNPGAWEQYKTEKRIALTPTDGLKTVRVRFRDNAGIESDEFNDTIYFDLDGPGEIYVNSSTHPEPAAFYNGTEPLFTWEAPFETTGLKGYSYLVDGSPHSTPAKVLYTPNSEITGTFPGEFSGLADGTWYFHIIACDIYGQWGITSHFRFNIDTSLPVITETTPDGTQWYNGTGIRTSAVFTDIDSYGLDVESIMYSAKVAGGTFSPWSRENLETEVLETGMGNNPTKVGAWVDVGLEEGHNNGIRWKITDLAGNGPVMAESSIKVDRSPVTFIDHTPDEEEMFLESEVTCGVSISDGGASGVDGKTVQYSISELGNAKEFFKNWTNVNNNMVKDPLEVFLEITFVPGNNNYIRWRAMDAVGNGYAVSDPFLIWINSPPIPVMGSPIEGHTYKIGDEILLNATGSRDNEGDELDYTWVFRNKTTKITIFTRKGMKAVVKAENGGDYLVYLYVDDGNGFNESIKVNIFVYEGKGDVTPDGEIIPPGKEAEKEDDSSNVLLLIAGLAVLLIVIVLVIWFVFVKRRKKEEEPAPVASQYGGRPGPYRQGYMGLGPGGYGTPGQPGMQTRYGGYGTQYPDSSPPYGSGAAPPFLALPPGPILPGQQPQQQYPAGSAQPPIQALPGPQGVPGPDMTYSLPIFSTDEGPQNINRLALPPGPSGESLDVYNSTSSQQGPPEPDNAPDFLQQIMEMDIGSETTPFPVEGAPMVPVEVDSPSPPSPPPVPQELPEGAPPLQPEAPIPPVPEAPGEPKPPAGPAVPALEDTAAPPPNTAVQCHSCGMEYDVSDATRPIVIECPGCHVQGYLSE